MGQKRKMDKFDIVIIAGQSNAEGFGVGKITEEYVENPKIIQLEQPFEAEHTPERVIVTFGKDPVFSIASEKIGDNGKIGNLALSFAKSYVDNGLLKENRKLLIVRFGIGGTGFKKGNWGLTGEVYLKMMELIGYALSMNRENKLVAFLWHQGEHDAFEKNDPDVFEEQLYTMITSVRERYQNPSLPFITGDFVQDWKNKNLSDCQPIVDKIQAVVKRVADSAFIETNGLLSNDEKNANGDDIHFCRESLYELGKRYFQAFLAIVKE